MMFLLNDIKDKTKNANKRKSAVGTEQIWVLFFRMQISLRQADYQRKNSNQNKVIEVIGYDGKVFHRFFCKYTMKVIQLARSEGEFTITLSYRHFTALTHFHISTLSHYRISKISNKD